jgi:hypothetical protein
MVVFVTASDTVATGTTLTSNQPSLNFSLVTSALSRTSLDTTYVFVSNAPAAGNAIVLTFDCSADAATGAIITVIRISGITKDGVVSIKQSAKIENQAASGTPAITFGSSVLTGNPTLVAVTNSSNPAALAQPVSWTERSDNGYGTPPTGQESATRDSGFTGTTVTWNGTSASAFSAVGVEVDASACTGICIYQDGSTEAGSGTDGSVGLLSSSIANDYFYVAVGLSNATATITTISDTCSDTFTQATSSPARGANSSVIVYTAKTSGGCGTITITISTSVAHSVSIIEYSGLNTTSAVDCDTKGTGTGTAFLTTGPTCTTSVPAAILIATSYQLADAIVTPGTSYVNRLGKLTGATFTYKTEDQIVSATGTYTGSATSATSAEWVMHMIALKNATQPPGAITQVGAFLVGP